MKALLIVDMENDFMPGGALGVPGADKIVPLLNALMEKFSLVVMCEDFHPADHVSFAASHPGKKPGDRIQVKGFEQVLWPVHCVRNTKGAEIVSELNKDKIASIFYKGTDKNIDSYSAFFDNARQKSTGLGDYLKSHKITDLYVAGVATDYCVLYSSLDALELGFRVYVITDACRPINLKKGDEQRALDRIVTQGGKLVTSKILLS
jgi:nicotinamidase/pyrazinamidase